MLYGTGKDINDHDSGNDERKTYICRNIKVLLEIKNSDQRNKYNTERTPDSIGNSDGHGFHDM